MGDPEHVLPLPRRRETSTYELEIHAQAGRFKFYLAVSRDAEGHPVELWVDCAKEGTMLREFMHGWAALFSIALQNRVPLPRLVHLYKEWQFEPCGRVGGYPAIQTTPSILSLVVSVLEIDFPAEMATDPRQQNLWSRGK